MKLFKTIARNTIILLLLCCILIPVTVSASGTKKLKVGAVVADRFTKINDGGYYSGYGYEYLHEITKYTGWEYSYTWGSFDANNEKLSTGKIDLFGPMIKTPETEALFAFPDYSCGISYTTLCIDGENTERYGYNDLQNINGKTIGMLSGMPENKPFIELCESIGLTIYPAYYENSVKMMSSLNSGEIEIILSTTLQEMDGTKTIAKLTPQPFYFVTSKGNTEIIDSLNNAIKSIQLVTPQLEARLYKKYYSANGSTPLSLSEAEMRFIKKNPIVYVVHDPDHYPVESYDPETDTCSGITSEIFKIISEETGLKFEYIPTESFANALSVIAEGDADIICGIKDDYNLADNQKLNLATPYLDMDMVSVKHNKVFPKEKFTIAITEGHSLMNRHYLLTTYPGAKIVYYPSTRECILAVHKGEADLTFADRYSVEEAQKEPSVNNLIVSHMPDFDYKLTVGIRKSIDPTLMVIINKAINNISEKEMNDIITKCTTGPEDDVTFTMLIYRNPFQAILILLIFFVVILIVFSQIIRLRKKHAEEVELLAYYDSATECWNNNKFTKEASQLILKNHNTRFAVCVFDIKKFKFINENYGHPFGDDVLRQTAAYLEKYRVENMYYSHKAADKFNLILPARTEERATEAFSASCYAKCRTSKSATFLYA